MFNTDIILLANLTGQQYYLIDIFFVIVEIEFKLPESQN